jgi:hypothetical protein
VVTCTPSQLAPDGSCPITSGQQTIDKLGLGWVAAARARRHAAPFDSGQQNCDQYKRLHSLGFGGRSAAWQR